MRTFPLSLAMVAAVAAVSAAPRQATAETIPFSKIPVLPTQPSASAPAPKPPAPAGKGPAQPDKIPTASKVDGFFPAILPDAKRKDAEKDGYRYVQVFTNDKDQHDYAVDGTYNKPLDTTPDVHQCLSSSSGSSTLSSRLSFYFRTKPYPYEITENARRKKLGLKPMTPASDNTVRNVHEERLTTTADSATLETIEAQIDLGTLGMRLVSKSSVKLAKVASAPGGMGVFAGRDEKGNTQFLVTRPDVPAPPSDDVRQAFMERMGEQADRLVTQLPTGATADSACGHVRFSLTSKKGSGQMATVLGSAFLPPARDADEAPPSENENVAQEEEDENSFRAMQQRMANRIQRVRPVAINVSLSQLATEDDPLLSVTFGWAGKDEKISF